MKRLFLLLALLCPLSLTAQPIIRNPFTTNNPTIGTGAVVAQGNLPIGVNNTDTNTFLKSFGAGTAPSFARVLSINGTNKTPANFTDSATVTWALSGTNWTANAVGGGDTIWTNDAGVIHPIEFSTNAVAANFLVAGSTSVNTNVALTVDQFMSFNTADAGPYLSGEVVGAIDILTLGLAGGVGGTKATQRITTSAGTSNGGVLQVQTANGVNGLGGNIIITAGNGTNDDGGTISINAGGSTGGNAGTVALNALATGNIILTSPSGIFISGPTISDSTLSLQSQTNLIGDNGTSLTFNGQPIGGTSETNVQNNFYTTNMFFVSGKGNTLVITQALTLNYVKTNLLSTDANGLVTTTKFGAGITWDPATQTISGNGSAESPINYNTLTYSTTNVTLDCSLGTTNFAAYKLNLTNNAFFVTPTSVPTNSKWFVVYFQQPSTGTCLVSWTNASFFFPGGNTNQFQPLTNGSSMSAVAFRISPFTNSVLLGDYGLMY